MKPKMFAAFTILAILVVFGYTTGIDHGWIPAPGSLRAAVLVLHPQGMDKDTIPTVQQDGDWDIMEHIIALNEDRYEDTTGYPALDNALRFLWNNAGVLMLVFAMLAFLTSGLLDRTGETHNEQMRREAEELEQPGLSDDIHEPFDVPEGMQPTTQYEPIRTRR